jgi:putative membrane protein
MKLLSLSLCLCLVFLSCDNDDDDNATVTDQDKYFMEQASYSNLAEVSAGTIAAVKGDEDSVRMFGGMMVSDHSTAQSSLDSLSNSLSVSLPSMPDSAHQAIAAHLQTLSGNVFDTTYIGAQVRDHMATIAIFQQELSTGNNKQVKDYANKNLPIIQMHLQEAQSIQQLIQ